MNEILQTGWSWYPSVIIGFGLWTAIYAYAVHKHGKTSTSKQIAFHSGTVIALFALVSPLDELGDEYLFSAHMIQHLLFLFAASPLWLIGTPGWLIEKYIPSGFYDSINRVVNPIISFLIFAGVIIFWHIPGLYELAQEYESIHIVEHLSYMICAVIGWWPIVGAEMTKIVKPSPPIRMLYLFLLALPCTSLAAILTFSKEPLYKFYISAPHIFGLNALQDQHLGGLLMWLPTHIILLISLAVTFRKWNLVSNQTSITSLDQYTN
jgi:cytochrome c oxidase assembly factor CtaG